MQTIWKFPLKMQGGIQAVSMPEGAKVLSVGPQRLGELWIWALVNPEARTVSSAFQVIGTGHPCPDTLDKSNHIGTVQDGPFVWHVFGWVQ